MLLIKTKIGRSDIAGIGLFADEFVPKGTPIWKLQDSFDIQLSQDEFLALSEPAQTQVLNYCYYNSKTGKYVVCGDDARFFNHSIDPNCSSSDDDYKVDVALRDIRPGEELTQDYGNFDGQIETKLGRYHLSNDAFPI